MTAPDFRERARRLVAGDGSPRSRDAVIAEVASALAAAFTAGLEAGERRTRDVAKMEPLAALAAAISDLERVRRTLSGV